MIAASEISPGTVSKILWHFTGGPGWDPKAKKQNISPKPAAQAYENLKSILSSKELRLGNYKEIIKVIIPKLRRYSPEKQISEIEEKFSIEVESSPVCCLSDIPAPHLKYHAYRYGKFAIGFHRSATIRHGFNPVFYTLANSRIIQSIYIGFSSLKLADPGVTRKAVDIVKKEATAIRSDFSFFNELMKIDSEAKASETVIEAAQQSLEGFVAFVKTFESSEFATIYCEREWRSTKTFKFNFDDIAMVVIPKKVGKELYYRNFVENVVPQKRFPRRIPVVPWDDLIEH